MPYHLPSLTRDNLALYTIPAAWVIALSPRLFAASLYQSKTNKPMDGCHPRDFAKNATNDATLDARAKAQIVRAEAAQANGFENIGLFAAAVVAGSAAGVSPKVLNGISFGYLISRVAYNFIYITNETPEMGYLRSGVYIGGLAGVMALFVEAANKLRKPLFA